MAEALQIQRLAGGSIAAAAPVMFDEVTYSTGGISYDPLTGVISLQISGRYIVNWCVATQMTVSPNGAVFTLSSSQGDLLKGNSPLKTGEVTGVGIIDVAAAPVTVSLVNSAGGNVYYAPMISVKANLVISGEGSSTGFGDSSICFGVTQLAHIIQQLIILYPTSTMSVFTTNLGTMVSMPDQLYTSPDAAGPGLFVMRDAANQIDAVPLTAITAIYVGNNTVYDPSITYLTPPSPLPKGCDTDLIAAVRDYLTVGTSVQIRLGVAAVASGQIYRSEYGVVVLSDQDGNTPIFIPAIQIATIIVVETTLDSPRISVAPTNHVLYSKGAKKGVRK